jgi:sigma-B regulation protein RsbU (phosphoserine phosphatase)
LAPDERIELYEAAPVGFLVTQDNGLITRVNRRFCEWLDVPCEQLVGSKRFQDLLTVGSKIFHQTHWLPLLQIQGSVAEVQLELVAGDGRVLPMLINALRVPRPEGFRHELALFVAHDRRKYEQELLRARKRAEQLLESERAAQEALAAALRTQEREAQLRAQIAEQLIGIVSHDLRTPLNAITLGTGMLATSRPLAAQDRIVERIASAARRANRLLEDLLDFTSARIGGGLPIRRVPLDLHASVAETVEELKLTWQGRPLRHETHGAGSCVADSDRLAQLVINLVNNAMTYGTPEQPVTVTTRGEQAWLTLEVHNMGPAIAEALLPHIFEPLRRGEHQVKSGSRSVGLGLFIVHQIALAHGGTMEVHSSASEGTRFVLTLPSPDAALGT